MEVESTGEAKCIWGVNPTFKNLMFIVPFDPLKYWEKQNENESNFFIFSETFIKCFINSTLLYLSPMLLLWKKFNFYLAWILQKKKTKKQTNKLQQISVLLWIANYYFTLGEQGWVQGYRSLFNGAS